MTGTAALRVHAHVVQPVELHLVQILEGRTGIPLTGFEDGVAVLRRRDGCRHLAVLSPPVPSLRR